MADKYEKDIKDLIQQMQRQQSGYGMGGGQEKLNELRGPAPDQMGGTDQSPHLYNQGQNMNNPDQSPENPINSVRPMGKPISVTPRSELTKPTPVEGGCPQCGIIHPPLRPGEKCPMAKVKVQDESGKETEVDVNKFLAQLKNIIISQAEQKKIKDYEKLFKNIILEVTKYLEGYSE
jgi:hypothetical protein